MKALMVELVDTRDLKSLAVIGVRVRVPLGAPEITSEKIYLSLMAP